MNPMNLFRSVLAVAAAAGVLLCAGARPAQAQLDIIPKFRLKAGLFLPTDTSLKNATSNTWLKVGADVGVPFGPNLPVIGSSTKLGVEYAVNGSTSLIPITLSLYVQPSAVKTSPVYAGAGVGVWTARGGGSTASRLGYRLLAGVDLSARTFVEVQYDVVGRLRGTRVDGFSLMAGLKF
jgi:hypothetical protein